MEPTVEEAIDIIRADIQLNDEWDEEQIGANWIENEFGLFLNVWDALKTVRGAAGLSGIIHDDITTVEQYQEYIASFDQSVISAFYLFCTNRGSADAIFYRISENYVLGLPIREDYKSYALYLLEP
jgi:hypothetical protein